MKWLTESEKREKAGQKGARTGMVHKALLNEDKPVDDNIATTEMMLAVEILITKHSARNHCNVFQVCRLDCPRRADQDKIFPK